MYLIILWQCDSQSLVSMHAVYNDVSMTALPQECLVGGLVVIAVKRTETKESFFFLLKGLEDGCNVT